MPKDTKNTEKNDAKLAKNIDQNKLKTNKVKSTASKKAVIIKDEIKPKKIVSKNNENKIRKALVIDEKVQNSVIEYYDLPYRYNQTIVRILAQTPNILFVYWDISEDDKKDYKKHYGDDFFNTTRPVLIIHNETMNYNFEIEINDFANSWYLNIKDANCKYNIELGRRPNNYTSKVSEKYIRISSSNIIDSPNNHILFENFKPNVTFKNVNNNKLSSKDFGSIAFVKNMQNIYNIYDLYKKIYNDELLEELISNISNPSSDSLLNSTHS